MSNIGHNKINKYFCQTQLTQCFECIIFFTTNFPPVGERQYISRLCQLRKKAYLKM